jgi:protease-4
MRRLLTVFLVLAALGVAVAALGLLVAGRARPAVPAGARIVTVALGGSIPDYRAAAPLDVLSEREPLHLAGLWQALERLRDDRSVRALAVRIRDLDVGIAKAQELRRQLGAVAAAGKPVLCYLDSAGEGTNGTLEYYLASACSEISLAPLGEINLLGLRAEAIFLRGSLDKLKIEPSFLTAGRYKSAAEVFTEREFSPAAREALEAVIDGYFEQIVAALAEARGLPPAAVRRLIDQAPLSAERALAAGLIDHVEYPDELRSRLDDAHGEPSWQELAAAATGQRAAGEIAVLFAQGTIVLGNGGADPWTGEAFVGADGLGRQLADFAEDDGVKAVVLRVDSPGGSAVASDLLHRRVERLAAEKPVVVSMSDVAASGGYYLAAKASRIFAEPATLTGSIGVISGKLATGRFETELLGATRDAVSRGANAGIYSTARPFDDRERQLLETRIDEIYRRFLGVVADGRALPVEAVERVAGGRIWTGEDALARGLVDELGGFEAAIAAARELAGLDAGARVSFHPRAQGWLEWLAGERPPAFGGALARVSPLLELAGRARVPETLELPRALLHLSRPF